MIDIITNNCRECGDDCEYVSYSDYKRLEAENKKLQVEQLSKAVHIAKLTAENKELKKEIALKMLKQIEKWL